MDKWLRNQNVVLGIALIIALLLWLVVHMEDQKQTPKIAVETNNSREIDDVSIEAVGLDVSKFGLVSISPEDVRLRVIGKSSVLSQINPKTVKVRLDLSNAVKGKQSMKLIAIGFPSKVEVEIIPSNVTVTIEEMLTKEMSVVVESKGKAAEGLVVGAPIVQPNRVFVTTTESQIDQIAVIKGEIDVNGAEENVKRQIKLAAYNSNGEKIEADIAPPIVEVEVPISLPSKTVPLQIKINGTPAPGYSLSSYEQNPMEVVVYGDQQMLNGIDFYDGVLVDITNLSGDRTVTVDIPLKTAIARIEPSKVEVKLHISPSERRTFTNVKLMVAGVVEPLEAVVTNPPDGLTSVTLEGAPEVLSRLTPNDIDLIVDVGNLSVGVHQVNVSYSLPAFVRVVEETPTTVTVEVKEISKPTDVQPEQTAGDGSEQEPNQELG